MSLTSFDQPAGNSYSFDDWINSDCLDYPTSTVELPGGPSSTSSVNTPPLLARNHTMVTPDYSDSARRPLSKEPHQSSQVQPWQTNLAANPFASPPTLPAIQDDFQFQDQPSLNSSESQYQPNAFNFDMAVSPTPSLSGPESPFSHHEMDTTSGTATAASSPRRSSLKRSAPSSPVMDTIPPASKRMLRNRPHGLQGQKHMDASSTSPSASSRISKTRQPHNQVEKKYREGLNNELERLRRAVRTLPQPRTRSCSTSEEDDDSYGGYSAAVPKPSKAAVLAGAVEYIKYLEAEHERLANENEQLRELEGLRRRREEGWAWTRRGHMGFVN
ncbi:membrane-tethered transcription factor [Diplodia corticola]|uniref:Membrane-tethered transcription factor n=1 Tax=Diplodia corticola TaxID=236234 RepID=A0A1J9QLD5_9PEZI|nr:membrane-tethered transcription factor [Diplodia corticola]OJD28874.1 membrane-tethered transcription factor [Diplodia corticola]